MALRMMTLNRNILPNNCVMMSPNNAPVNHVSSILQSKRQIAPAKEQKPVHNSTIINNNSLKISDGKYKRKYNYNGVPYSGHQTASVARRNARERNRVKQVNNGFANLRQHIPVKVISSLSSGGRGASKKLSKVDTLRLAVEYIRSLQHLLDETESKKNASTSSCYSTSHSSEISISPAPSVTSDASSSFSGSTIYSNNQKQPPFKIEPYDNYNEYHSESSSPIYNHNHYVHPPSTPSFRKTTAFNDYNAITPEDEELLDTITWWQQQD